MFISEATSSKQEPNETHCDDSTIPHVLVSCWRNLGFFVADSLLCFAVLVLLLVLDCHEITAANPQHLERLLVYLRSHAWRQLQRRWPRLRQSR